VAAPGESATASGRAADAKVVAERDYNEGARAFDAEVMHIYSFVHSRVVQQARTA
jgi:hypothetical protein